MRYIIYCRKSSESEDRQALSIEAQKRELQEYAQRNNLSVIDILEESQSAYKPGRPIFEKLMVMYEQKLADGILCWKVDRLARNARDGGRVIQAIDDGFLKEIRTPYELFKQEDNRVMLYLHFGMSNDLSRQISANVKRGNRQKCARGEYVGASPLGYINVKAGNSRNIAPNPETASLVKRLFEEYAKGNSSVLEICRKSVEWGLKTKTGINIPKSAMYKLLTRPLYYGLFQHGGEFHQGSYEPLISKELFDQVQLVLKGKGVPRKQSWIHAYKGLIKCPCGCYITAETKEKHYARTNRDASYTYYRCTRRRGVCKEPGVTEQELEGMLFNNLSRITIDKEVWELGVELLKAKHGQEIEESISTRKRLEEQKTKVDKRLGVLLNMRLDERITEEEYADNKKKLIEEKMELEEKTNDREGTLDSWLERAENFFETAFQAREIMEKGNNEKKRDLIRSVGWNLLLRDKNLEFSFRKPFDILLQPEVRSDLQGWSESNTRYRFWRPVSYH
ncbi:MAG: recombinase [Microgenomates group bacterium Gr01-1014_5]|nr:MAG: recombinase [Microgenomates group bacterium Gr01-1014_5]